MKSCKIILFALLVLTSPTVQSQDYPAAGSYITNNSLANFEEVWRWTNGIDTVQIRLMVKKVFYPINGGFYWDRLVGWHIYKSGQSVLESSYQFINDVDKSTFLGGNENRPPAVYGTFDDISKSKSGNLELKIDTTVTPNRLTWALKNSEGLKYRKPTDPPYQSGFTLPRNMILIKQ